MGKHSPGTYMAWAAILVVTIMAYRILSPIILSFILIVLITLALNPIVLRLRGIIGGRKVAAIVLTLVFLAVIGGSVWAFLVPIMNSTAQVSKRVPEYWERIQRPLIKLEKQAAVSSSRLDKEVTREVAKDANAKGQHGQARELLEQTKQPSPPAESPVHSGFSTALQGAALGFKTLAYTTAQMVVVAVTVFFGVVFTLMNPRPVFRSIFALVPSQHHEQALRIATRIARFVPNWALSTLLGMLVIGLLVFLLMWPIFGFADALVLGVIAGVLEAVPYLGPTLSAVPGVLLALGKGGSAPLWVLLAYILVQALENNVVLPLIMARGMDMHPAAVIFSMLLCVAAFGVLGVIIASPMVAIAQILHDELYRKRFLPGVSTEDLEKLARKAMGEAPAPAPSPTKAKDVYQPAGAPR